MNIKRLRFHSLLVKETTARVLFLIGVLLVLFLPFLNKAFHMDDVAFINLSKMIDWNPLRAIPLDYPYMGGVLSALLPYDSTHPLLIPYLIKIVRTLIGESETSLHAVFLLFPLICVFALARLNSLLFPNSAGSLPLMLFFSMPAFLVMSHSIMTDVPTLAFLLLSATFFCSAIEHKHQSRFSPYIGGLFFTMAIFSSYTVVFLLPVFFLYAVIRKKLSQHVIFSLIMPVFMLGLWLWAIYNTYGILPILKSGISGSGASIADEIGRYTTAQAFVQKGVSILAEFGASLFFVLLFYAVRSGRLKRLSLSFVIVTAACYAICFCLGRLRLLGDYITYTYFEKFLLSALTSLGVMSIYEIWKTSLTRYQSSTGLPVGE